MKRQRLAEECVLCLVNKHVSLENEKNVQNKAQAMLDMLKIVANASIMDTAPEVLEKINEYKEQKLGIFEDFSKEKQKFNSLMLLLEDELEKSINSCSDQFAQAVKLCLAANYIDFGSLDGVNEDDVKQKIKEAASFNVDKKELEQLKNDVLSAKKLVYLVDNCGEIVLDKLFIKLILKLNPTVKLDVIVRGGPILNDCTIEDAYQVGLDKIVPVTSNGTKIAGTRLCRVNEQTRQIINDADVIISKGQGNFETMRGEGKNTYFLFLCKCSLFAREFSVPLLTPMLINDLRI